MERYNEIYCLGKDGGKGHKFKYLIENEDKVLHFLVYPEDAKDIIDCFQISVEKKDDATGRIIMMDNKGLLVYSKKGLARRMILELGATLPFTITSSSNRKAEPGESRSDEASNVWESLRTEGLASYDSEVDRYTLLNNPKSNKLAII